MLPLRSRASCAALAALLALGLPEGPAATAATWTPPEKLAIPGPRGLHRRLHRLRRYGGRCDAWRGSRASKAGRQTPGDRRLLQLLGRAIFPDREPGVIWRHGSVPLVFWSPWDRPYEEDQGRTNFRSPASLAREMGPLHRCLGGCGAKAFGHPLMVSFANEMNGSWFPWSGHVLRRGQADLPESRA